MEDYLIGDFANKIMRGQISKKQAETEVVPSSSSVKSKFLVAVYLSVFDHVGHPPDRKNREYNF